MELEKAKRIADEIGLEVGSDLILYKNGKEVGKIYRVENTDQYTLTADFQEQTKVNLEKILGSSDKIRLGKDCRNAPGEIAIIDEVKKWGVICYVPYPTDKNQRLYLRVEYGPFELVSTGKTLH